MIIRTPLLRSPPRLVRQTDAPVLLVGHSYGGAGITNAGSVSNVIGLVYVAAFAPEEGERVGGVEEGSKDSVLNSALIPWQYPMDQGTETATEFAINPARLREVFAADLPEEQTAVMAVTQRPIACGGLFRYVRARCLEAAAVVGGGGHR